MEVCITFGKQTLKKGFGTINDTHLALLQIRSTPLGLGLPSPAALSFNCPLIGIMPVTSRAPIISNNNDDNYDTVVERQGKADKNYDTLRNYNYIAVGSTVVVAAR